MILLFGPSAPGAAVPSSASNLQWTIQHLSSHIYGDNEHIWFPVWPYSNGRRRAEVAWTNHIRSDYELHKIGPARWSRKEAADDVLFCEVGDDMIDYALHGKADGLMMSGQTTVLDWIMELKG